MSEVPRVLDWFERGVLLRPSADVANAVDLARALASLTGATDIDLASNAQHIAAMIGRHEHYVLVMVDGLGMNLVEREAPGAFFRRQCALTMQSVFPSSTAPALTSLATACWPAQHAVTGWFTYLPSAGLDTRILPFTERYSEEDLRRRGVSPDAAFPVRAVKTAYNQFRVLPKIIDGSVYSVYSSGGAPSYGYESLSAAIGTIEHAIATAARPTSTYFYIPFIDNAEHEHGLDSKQTRDALDRVHARLESLAETLSGRARIIITADHGQIAVTADERHDLDPEDSLLDVLKMPPTCEPRVPAFHVRDGRHTAFEEAFRQRFGDRFALLTLDEADELRLFGPEPMIAETRARLGDYIALAHGRDIISVRRDVPPLVGFHGGALPDEMRIPLILA